MAVSDFSWVDIPIGNIVTEKYPLKILVTEFILQIGLLIDHKDSMKLNDTKN